MLGSDPWGRQETQSLVRLVQVTCSAWVAEQHGAVHLPRAPSFLKVCIPGLHFQMECPSPQPPHGILFFIEESVSRWVAVTITWQFDYFQVRNQVLPRGGFIKLHYQPPAAFSLNPIFFMSPTKMSTLFLGTVVIEVNTNRYTWSSKKKI